MTEFRTSAGVVRAVDGVSFEIRRGQTMGLVGESGCGKSVTALSILKLIDFPGRIAGGRILFDDLDLAEVEPEEMRQIRGHRIAMIFQEPMTSLNPVFTIGDQIAETVEVHKKVKRKEAWDRAIEMLKLVGIPSPERRVHDYPHHMSGGMRQRAMIAMALSCDPELLIADEPTTALDVTTQAQILELLADLQEQNHMAIMLITHNLGVVAEMADDVVVMYLGRVVEEGPVDEIFYAPKHPYTQLLLKSIPSVYSQRRTKLPTIAGSVPHPYSRPQGCPFHPR